MQRGLILLTCPLALGAIASLGLALSSPEASAPRGDTLGAAKYLLARGDRVAAERILRGLSGSEARFLLGQLLAESGRWSEARPALLDALSGKEWRPRALRLLAKGAMESGDWIAACQHLSELEHLDPRDPSVPKALASCQLRSSDPLAALAATQRGLSLAPDDRDLISLMNEAAEATVRYSLRPAARHHEPQSLSYRRRNR